MPRSLALVLLVGMLAAPAAAQFPGTLAGVVTDAATGAPVAAALVEVPAAGRGVRTDAAGAFSIRGMEPGPQRVVVRRTGYAEGALQVVVRDGSTTRVAVVLIPAAVVLPGVSAAGAPRRPGEVRVERAAIEASGARNLAEVLERSGGVLVVGTGPTAERRVSIRGSAADAVLVLVDGVAANDPVTGEADLTQVPAQGIQAVTVLAGARSARYGPRAAAGVVLVETRSPGPGRSAAASGGTLGERAAAAEWGTGSSRSGASLGAHGRSMDGRFEYRAPFTGERAVRQNADLAEAGAWAAAGAALGGGELRARLGWSRLERGIPGRAYRLSPRARQEGETGRTSLSWRRPGGASSLQLSVAGELRRMHFANPAPPDSFPFDSRVRARTLTARGELQHAYGGLLRGWAAGAEASLQRVEAGTLSEAAPASRVDGGVWGTASARARRGRAELALSADLRLDRDGLRGDLTASHALALSAAQGAARAQLAHRSSYSPPTLGDQFFREGVAIAPNPHLQAERVPSEWEISASMRAQGTRAEAEVGGAAFLGDVRGMIIWSPDHRGVWSPRNMDVNRAGAELFARVRSASLPLGAQADWSLARLTYDWGAEQPEVQVVYRPRSAGALRLTWEPGPWRGEVAARYTGWRNPSPGNANRLPGFWTMAARVGRSWKVGGSLLEAAVDVDRLGNERDALVFGHPEPGRRVRFDLRLLPGAGIP